MIKNALNKTRKKVFNVWGARWTHLVLLPRDSLTIIGQAINNDGRFLTVSVHAPYWLNGMCLIACTCISIHRFKWILCVCVCVRTISHAQYNFILLATNQMGSDEYPEGRCCPSSLNYQLWILWAFSFCSDRYASAMCHFLNLFVIVCFPGYSQGLTPWLDPDSHLENAIC